MTNRSRLAEIITRNEPTLLESWLKEQLGAETIRRDLISERDLRQESSELLTLLCKALASGVTDVAAAPWADMRAFLDNLSASRAAKGFSPSETATFVFSLKQPIFTLLCKQLGADSDTLAEEIWNVTVLVDKLGLLTTDAFIRARQAMIARQAQEMLELSTPVVKLWEGILALPLIGTLDSARTQVVMENLLQQIVETGSQVAIIDITGVPMVDTLVAQHLLRTVTAARLMGAECIISGIRPQIAQTMVHLGVTFADVVTKATLAAALREALKLQGLAVTRQANKP